jgi:MFS transporter, DHA1 family, purine base/nucleoside efflux pump
MKSEPQSPLILSPPSKPAHEPLELLPIYCMSLGTFAIGTESFMIAPLLPQIAGDLTLPISQAAMLVTVFTLTLAISSPVLTVATGVVNRRHLLIGAMVTFAVANMIAWRSAGFTGILIARVLLALSAGLYLPNASALAGAMVSPEKRGRALAIVTSGATIAVALGLPFGSVIGHAFGWRTTFFCVALIALIAVIGLFLGISKGAGKGIRVAGFSERIRVAGQPAVIKALSLTFFWAMGSFVAFPFIAPYLHKTVGFDDNAVSGAVFLWGVSAAMGMVLGESLNDRFSPFYVIGPALGLLTLAYLVLAGCAAFLSPNHASFPVVAAIIVWGVAVWGFHPAQMAHMIGIVGAHAAPVVLSLNTSVMYIGFSAGSALGAFVIANFPVSYIGLAAAGGEAVALVLFLFYGRKRFLFPRQDVTR